MYFPGWDFAQRYGTNTPRQRPHNAARTTQAVRRASQRSQASLQALATRHGVNLKTVAKWRKRPTVQDARMGPIPASTVRTTEQEAVAVAFRHHALLPLDDSAFTPCKPRFHAGHARRCTGVFSATASVAYP